MTTPQERASNLKAAFAEHDIPWPKPPQIVLNKLTPCDLAVLRKYISKIQNRVYRIAFDNGHCYAMREQQKHMRRSKAT